MIRGKIMEFRQVYISKNVDYKKEITYVSNGKVFVSGLGEVEIKECLSHETIDNIEKEVIFALRHKLGLVNIAELTKATEDSNEKD